MLGTLCSSSNPNQQLNVVEALQDFWRDRYPPESGVGVTYESQAGYEPPYVCFVQLPGGCLFRHLLRQLRQQSRGSPKCRQSGPDEFHIQTIIRLGALLENLLIEPLPRLRHRLAAARGAMEAGVDAFRLMLESKYGQDYAGCSSCSMERIFASHATAQLHQIPSDRALSGAPIRRRYALPDGAGLDSTRADRPGLLRRELTDSQEQLLNARLQGKELRFYKEKCDILALALSQCDEVPGLTAEIGDAVTA
uniref:ELMO domain-containing protein n=1 Tax=Macrostomum lignano TaxID=282301 RepID=A0A1I8FMF5_9PLAT